MAVNAELSAGQGGPSASLLRLRAILKDYPLGQGTLAALQGIDLDVEEGEFVAITGPSGSGKSTLMNIIGCLDNPTSGEYWLAGRDVSRLDEAALAQVRNRQIGFVFQSFNLLARATALANVELPLVYGGVPSSERRQRALQALETVGLADRQNHRPGELSGGQCQRVAIARALVTGPRLLLADEPTGNLDSHTTEELLAHFQQIHAAGHTLVLVTHEGEVARRATRAIRMRDGMIAEDTGSATGS